MRRWVWTLAVTAAMALALVPAAALATDSGFAPLQPIDTTTNTYTQQQAKSEPTNASQQQAAESYSANVTQQASEYDQTNAQKQQDTGYDQANAQQQTAELNQTSATQQVAKYDSTNVLQLQAAGYDQTNTQKQQDTGYDQANAPQQAAELNQSSATQQQAGESEQANASRLSAETDQASATQRAGEGEQGSAAQQADASQPALAEADQLTATVSPDEKYVTIVGRGDSFRHAASVEFRVWSMTNGQDDLVSHGAVRQPDGSWMAKVFIAAKDVPLHDVPYNCQIAGAVHRLYNDYDKLHLYTDDLNEARNLARAGWNYEGVAWVNPPTTDPSGLTAIYRLYNPFSGDHHFTTDRGEYNTLASRGWIGEGIKLYGMPGTGYPVYRLYHPKRTVDTHLFTTSRTEYDTLPADGWVQEGARFFGAMASTDGAWSASGTAKPHTDTGAYEVSAYVGGAAATPVTTFSISAPTGSVSLGAIDNAHGTFDVIVSGIASRSGVSKVEVPIWSEVGGQDDIVWYEATPQSDGTYKATASVARHNVAYDYTAHAYVTGGNGIRSYVGATHASLNLANYLRIDGGQGNYRATLYNPGAVGWVKMAVWSAEGGQDDIVWYDAQPNGDGTWTANVSAKNLKHAGTVYVHAYADNQMRNSTSFTVDPSELSWSGDPELDKIVDDILNVIGRDGDVLRKAFNYVAAYPYIRTWDTPSGDFTREYAKQMYRNHGGNCYRYASLFKWIAKRLGYNARVVVGAVPSMSNGWNPHGWVEIAEAGQWYLYDPDMVQNMPSVSFYRRTYGAMPFTYRIDWYS